MNFWYSEQEIDNRLPIAGYLGVFGKDLKHRFNIYEQEYLNNPHIFLIGPMRFRNIQNKLKHCNDLLRIVHEKEHKRIVYDILVIMPSKEQIALELWNRAIMEYKLQWVGSKQKRNKIVIKPHPDNSRDLFQFEGDIALAYGSTVEDLLGKSNTVISVDSSVEFTALALGKQVISPSLPSFVNLSPLDKNIDKVKDYINNYFDFSKDEREELNKI